MKNKAATKTKPEAKPNPPQAAPAQPVSLEQMYDELNRRLKTFLGMHKVCSAPICKRMQRCLHPTYQCERDFPQPPLTDAEAAQVSFRFRKLLDAEIERRKALGQWRGGALSAALSAGPSARVSSTRREPYPCKASPDRPPSSRRGARS